MPAAEDVNFKQEVEETLAAFPGANTGQQFARAVLEFGFGLTHEEAVNANANDGARDRGLDAFYVNDDHFYLIQFKHHDNPFGQSVAFSASGAGNQLVHCWPYVSDLARAASELTAGTIRRELYDAAVKYNDEVTSGGKKVRMVVVEWADGDTANAAASGRTWVESLPRGHPIEEFMVYNFPKIRAIWEELKIPISRFQGEVPMEYLAGEGWITVTGPLRAVVIQVQGKHIVQLYRAVGEALFDPNVRFDLRETNFNIKIKHTATREPANFWYYNNGITIICDDFRPEGEGKFILSKPGLVNGGQTVKQLYQAGALTDDLKVLVRVIKSNGRKFDQDVALYTNSQNPIKLRDLRSNEPEQIRYETEFAGISPPWFYERKKAAWEITPLATRAQFVAASRGRGRRPVRRLNNEQIGKAVLSFSINEPVVAKTQTPAIWTSGGNGYYDQIFVQNRDVYELVLASLTNIILDEQQASFTPPSGTGTIEEVKDCIPQLTALVGFLVQEKYGGMPLRIDLRRLYSNLIDPATHYIATTNFVSRLFSDVLWPFVTWYNRSRLDADPRWQPSNWYKDRGKWNVPGNVATMLPAFSSFRSYTPPAQRPQLATVIP